MEQRKRMNPEITPADLAVNAFDRNDDSVQKKLNPELTEEDRAVHAFDKLIESAIQQSEETMNDLNITKTDDARRQELCDLFIQVFGSFKEGVATEKPVGLDTATAFTLVKSSKTKWYKPVKNEDYVSILIDFEEQVRNSSQYETKRAHFVENGKYAPLKLIAHTPEALAKSKIFAVVYKKLTGQNVSIVQNCADPIKDVKDLEQKVKEETKQEVKDEEVWKEVKQELGKEAKDFGSMSTAMIFVANSMPYAIPSYCRIIKTAIKKEGPKKENNSAENAGIATGFVIGVGGIIGQTVLYSAYPPLLLIPVGTNLASLGYEWVVKKYNTVKERKKKELEGLK